MAYSIYDLPNQNDPISGAAVPTGLGGLFQDRNFLSLLAGIGQGLDPKGIGGALGAPTRAIIASQAAQERAASQAAAQNAQTKMVIDALRQHGGLTPKESPGVTSFSATPEGVKFEVTPQAGEAGGLDQPIAPTAPIGATQNGAVAPTARSMVDLLSPFYSALLGLNKGL
jgi:hypothetical protein